MTTIKILFDNEFIEFETVEGVAGTTWEQHVLPGIRQGASIKSADHPGVLPVNEQHIAELWNNIRDNIHTVEQEFNVSWPESIPDEFTFDRQILNRFHRYFAQGTMFFNRWQIDSQYTFPTIPLEKQQRFTELLENVNFLIHEVERYCISENGKLYENKIKKLFLNLNNPVWRGEYIDQWLPHSMNPEYNVCLAMEVHGKNYLQAFLDGDDPTQVDIHGQRGMYGCLDIYSDNTVFELLESKEFKQWLGSRNIRDTGLVQIGKVIDSSRPLEDLKLLLKTKKECKFIVKDE